MWTYSDRWDIQLPISFNLKCTCEDFYCESVAEVCSGLHGWQTVALNETDSSLWWTCRVSLLVSLRRQPVSELAAPVPLETKLRSPVSGLRSGTCSPTAAERRWNRAVRLEVSRVSGRRGGWSVYRSYWWGWEAEEQSCETHFISFNDSLWWFKSFLWWRN